MLNFYREQFLDRLDIRDKCEAIQGLTSVIEVLRHDANDTLLKDVPRPRIGVNDATPPAINKPLSTAAMIPEFVLARPCAFRQLSPPARGCNPCVAHSSGRSRDWLKAKNPKAPAVISTIRP